MKAILKKIGVIIGAVVCGVILLFGLLMLSDASVRPPGIVVIVVGITGLVLLFKKKRPRTGRQHRSHSRQQRTQHARISISALPYSEILRVSDYAVLDVETTGLDPEKDEIIEIAAIRNKDGQVNTFNSFVKPRHGVPANITKLTGIRNSDVRNAPRIEAIMPQFAEFIAELPLIAHNAPFDLKFIAGALDASGIEMSMTYIDTLPMARRAYPGLQNYKLATLIKDLQLSTADQKHRAGSDTAATLKLFELCRCELISKQENERQAREKAAAEDKAFHLNQYGMQAEASGNIEKAIDYYEDAIADGAIMPNAYMRLAILYKKRRQWEDVIRVCDAALMVLPGTPGKLCQPEEYEKRRAYALEKLGNAGE